MGMPELGIFSYLCVSPSNQNSVVMEMLLLIFFFKWFGWDVIHGIKFTHLKVVTQGFPWQSSG